MLVHRDLARAKAELERFNGGGLVAPDVFEALVVSALARGRRLGEGWKDLLGGGFEARPEVEDALREAAVGETMEGQEEVDEEERLIRAFMKPLRETVGVFELLRDEEVANRWEGVVQNVGRQWEIIEEHTSGGHG